MSNNLSSFNSYLKSRGYATKTIHNIERTTLDFLAWLDKEGMEAEAVQHRDLLAYIKHLQQKEVEQITIERYIGALKHFYAYKVQRKAMKQNPVKNIKIQGIKRKKLHYVFTPDQLHGLYNSYDPENIPCPLGRTPQEHLLIERRNKVILGLYCYQGIQTAELVKLQTSNLNLRQGTIEILGTKRSNTRTLQLESHQILDIYDYILKTRLEIQDISKEQTENLFISPKGGADQSNYVTAMLRELRRRNPKVENAQQLRTSVIVKWLKHYNLIEVQQRAGHRYVSSTESYQVNNMDDLQDEISKYHPMG